MDDVDLRSIWSIACGEVGPDLTFKLASRVMLSGERRQGLNWGRDTSETTQGYAQIQPAQLKESVKFYEARALAALTT